MRGQLEKYNEVAVKQYERYVIKLQTERDKKTGQLKNPWAANKSLDEWVAFFEKVATTGFYIDGDNITIGVNGISLNYHAYKNLVIKKYPEAVFDIQLVRKGDEFSFKKENGKVIYKHTFSNPFGDDEYIGGYCIIKLRTGEFIELLSIKDLEQIRKTAKTDYIWRDWLSEMYLKSILKRSCKRHCKDAVEILDRLDNENYELLEGSEIDDGLQKELSDCTTAEEVRNVWLAHKGDKRTKEQTSSFIAACVKRKTEILGGKNEGAS